MDPDQDRNEAERAVIEAAKAYVKAMTTPQQYTAPLAAAGARLIAAVTRLEQYE